MPTRMWSHTLQIETFSKNLFVFFSGLWLDFHLPVFSMRSCPGPKNKLFSVLTSSILHSPHPGSRKRSFPTWTSGYRTSPWRVKVSNRMEILPMRPITQVQTPGFIHLCCGLSSEPLRSLTTL